MPDTDKAAAYGVTGLRLIFPGAKERFFDGLDFSYNLGEKILIVGANGCGKSTLLYVLAGLIPEHIEIAAKWQQLNVPPHYAYCLQDPEAQISMPHIDEEVAFVLENQQIAAEQMPQLIKQYCSLVQLTEANLHREVYKLSGGNKQKLQLATMLALHSQVLFLDEPTAMLDTQATQNFWQQIQQHFSHQAWIVVEHKISDVLPYITRLVVLDERRQIIADGKPLQVFATQKSYLQRAGIWQPHSWQDAPAPTVATGEEPTTRPLMELVNFSVYLAKSKIVTAPQLTVNKGEIVTIIGSNGAGKSTLLNGLAGLEKTSGSCNLYGVTSEQCSLVFQNPEYQFVTDKVIDELAYSLQFLPLTVRQSQQRVEEFLRRFNLTALQQRHPFSLSMGEKRRLSVAASLITRPALLLLDEPTLGLDACNSFNLIALLQQCQQQGTSIIMVTHEMQIVKRYATQVWCVEDGVVQAITARQLQQHQLFNRVRLQDESTNYD